MGPRARAVDPSSRKRRIGAAQPPIAVDCSVSTRAISAGDVNPLQLECVVVRSECVVLVLFALALLTHGYRSRRKSHQRTEMILAFVLGAGVLLGALIRCG